MQELIDAAQYVARSVFPETSDVHIGRIGEELQIMAEVAERSAARDRRIMRAVMLVEESGELLDAMSRPDIVETADALTDLCYVCIGIAVDFDLTELEPVLGSRMVQVREFLAKPPLKYDGGWPPGSSPTLESYGREIVNLGYGINVNTARREVASEVLTQTGHLFVDLSLGSRQVVCERLRKLLQCCVDAMTRFDMPFDELFDEVHRSNMTKVAKDARARDKGESYQPPNIKEILDARMRSSS